MTTIGILYPGEMGASLGRLLADNGFTVVTTLEGRSERTRRSCAAAGLSALSRAADVVKASDMLIALVPPAAAVEVAEHYCSLARLAPDHQLYVDANSISPLTASRVESLVARAGKDFVDAGIGGLASRLANHGTIYLSGPRAEEVAGLFSSFIRVKAVGADVGKASAIKMLMAGISKGVVALFLEMGLAAREAGLLDDLLDGCAHQYPGVLALIERMLPTMPRHAARRADEMGELERTILSLGLGAGMTAEARRTIDSISKLDLCEGSEGLTVSELIECIYSGHSLIASH